MGKEIKCSLWTLGCVYWSPDLVCVLVWLIHLILRANLFSSCYLSHFLVISYRLLRTVCPNRKMSRLMIPKPRGMQRWLLQKSFLLPMFWGEASSQQWGLPLAVSSCTSLFLFCLFNSAPVSMELNEVRTIPCELSIFNYTFYIWAFK